MTVVVPDRDTSIEADIAVEAERLLTAIDDQGVAARLIGGMAIKLLAAERLHPAFARPIQDLDFILTKSARREFDRLITAAGYVPQERFNALHGARRLLYDDPVHARQIDVFVDSFSMCHELPLAARITARARTLPPAEILMTKLQIVQLNEKDRGDLYALLLSHPVSSGDDAAIDAERIVALTSNDWGLQHTFELNLVRLKDGLGDQPLTAQESDTIAQRVGTLAGAIGDAPKTRRWKLRAKVGERKRWYEEPEEVDR
jgi:hypothetical protein